MWHEPPAIGQDQQGRDDRHRDHEGQEDRRAGDESELANPAEVGDREQVEGDGRRQGAEQDAGPAACRRPRHGERGLAAPIALLVVAEQEVDPVVDTDPDDDGDEHHREDVQVMHRKGDDSQRPAEADAEGREQQTRAEQPSEREQQQGQGEDEREDGGGPGVPGGGGQLVAEERGCAGHPGGDGRKLGTQRRDHAAKRADRLCLRPQGTRRPRKVDHDVEEPSILGEKIAGVGCAAQASGKQVLPR